MRILFLLLVLLPSLAWAAPVKLLTDTGNVKVTFNVDIADTEVARERGLMYRKDVPFGTGMLFMFDHPQLVNMWMKNTLVPLDMVFADKMGEVTYLVRDAIPHDLTPVGPMTPDTLYVLELKAGSIKRYNILLTDRLAIPQKLR